VLQQHQQQAQHMHQQAKAQPKAALQLVLHIPNSARQGSHLLDVNANNCSSASGLYQQTLWQRGQAKA